MSKITYREQSHRCFLNKKLRIWIYPFYVLACWNIKDLIFVVAYELLSYLLCFKQSFWISQIPSRDRIKMDKMTSQVEWPLTFICQVTAKHLTTFKKYILMIFLGGVISSSVVWPDTYIQHGLKFLSIKDVLWKFIHCMEDDDPLEWDQFCLYPQLIFHLNQKCHTKLVF